MTQQRGLDTQGASLEPQSHPMFDMFGCFSVPLVRRFSASFQFSGSRHLLGFEATLFCFLVQEAMAVIKPAYDEVEQKVKAARAQNPDALEDRVSEM